MCANQNSKLHFAGRSLWRYVFVHAHVKQAPSSTTSCALLARCRCVSLSALSLMHPAVVGVGASSHKLQIVPAKHAAKSVMLEVHGQQPQIYPRVRDLRCCGWHRSLFMPLSTGPSDQNRDSSPSASQQVIDAEHLQQLCIREASILHRARTN